MFKIMIDPNVIFDVLLNREPFVEGSYAVLDLCEKHVIAGIVPASCIADLYNRIYKDTQNTDTAYAAIGHILDILGVADVTAEDILRAYQSRAQDFENCLTVSCAIGNDCHYVITRNITGFGIEDVIFFSPEEFIELIQKDPEEEAD